MKKSKQESVSREARDLSAAANNDATTEVMAQAFRNSFEKLCLSAGLRAFEELMAQEAASLCGDQHQRHEARQGRRWGTTRSRVGYHGGEVAIDRPRVRTPDGKRELALPSWTVATAEDWLGAWAMNQMLINVSTRRFRRSVRLPEGDVGSFRGDATSKSAVSRRFVALSAAKMAEWLASDLSKLDLLAIQIDGLHVTEDLIVAARNRNVADAQSRPVSDAD